MLWFLKFKHLYSFGNKNNINNGNIFSHYFQNAFSKAQVTVNKHLISLFREGVN